jgi:hypothetical protein
MWFWFSTGSGSGSGSGLILEVVSRTGPKPDRIRNTAGTLDTLFTIRRCTLYILSKPLLPIHFILILPHYFSFSSISLLTSAFPTDIFPHFKILPLMTSVNIISSRGGEGCVFSDIFTPAMNHLALAVQLVDFSVPGPDGHTAQVVRDVEALLPLLGPPAERHSWRTQLVIWRDIRPYFSKHM